MQNVQPYMMYNVVFESLSVNRRTSMCVHKTLSLGLLKGDFLLHKVQRTGNPVSRDRTACPPRLGVCRTHKSYRCRKRIYTYDGLAYPDQAGNDAPLATSSCHPGSGSCRPGTDTHLWPSCRQGPPQLFPHHPR